MLFLIAVVIFFFNYSPIKWFCILFGSILQNIALLKKYKETY
ncbi:hypothetical protein COJ48_15365 [Bacillus cereus]|nr:hypothetical protein COJ48_15365 [Bacillus cereus]PGP77945.1 hypothetical protein CN997_21945 [Bacillus cereus]